MSRSYRFLNLAAVSLGLFTVVPAGATLSPMFARGEQIVEIPVAGKSAEVCILPKHFPGAKYSDKDLEKEKALCAMNESTNIAVCPKLESTNPGLNFFSVPEGMTIQQVEAKNCEVPDPKNPKKNLADKEAKYKLSTSCSYAPSIVGYYHMSRILGGIVNVPQAVIRTFDMDRHISIAKKALAIAPANDTISITWKSLLAQLTKGGASPKKDALMTDDFKQSYGALTENPKKEVRYKDMFNGGANNQLRATVFRDKNQFFSLVSKNLEVAKIVPRDFNQKNLQLMVQMKDVSDFILLDTIMNQEDRFGNIHAISMFYYRDLNDRDKQNNPKLKTKKNLTPEEISRLGAVQIQELMLKDNDCGVSRDNVLKHAGLAERIAHVDPKTYKRILKLDSVADTPEVVNFFKQGLVFTSSDWTSVRGNLKTLAAGLKKACTEGRLKLDLDLEAHFSGQPVVAQSCEVL